MKFNKGYIVLTLLLSIFALTACGNLEEENNVESQNVESQNNESQNNESENVEAVENQKWPTEFSLVPEFTAGSIENLEVIDEGVISMEFENITQERLDLYAEELLEAGFIREFDEERVFVTVMGDNSYAVSWNIMDSGIMLFLMKGPAEDGPAEIVVQWPTELDGITAFQGYEPNFASQNPDGLVTLDYSDVTDEAIDMYRKVLLADGFQAIETENGVEAYERIDAEGNSYIVAINPQNDLVGHLQIYGVITLNE